MEFAAIRHFADSNYCYAVEEGRFLIRLETKRGDASAVRLHVQEKYLPVSYRDTRQAYDMTLACSDRYRDYYEAVISMDVVCLRYFFQLEDASGKVTYFGNHGFYDTCITDIERMFDCPQTLREEERFQLPAWAENKVIYQIFPPGLPRTSRCPMRCGISPPSALTRTSRAPSGASSIIWTISRSLAWTFSI